MRKKNKFMEDPLEDYQGPTGTGNFVWVKNEDGILEARTPLKKTLIDPLALKRAKQEKLEEVFKREAEKRE